MIQDLVSSSIEAIAYAYTQMKERAIYRTLIAHLGEFPDPDTIRRCGMFVKCAQGNDRYEEMRWNGVGLFQIRMVIESKKVKVEVKDLV